MRKTGRKNAERKTNMGTRKCLEKNMKNRTGREGGREKNHVRKTERKIE